MKKKEKIDLFGALALMSLSALLGLNHVIIKVVNTGLNPVFFAGLRSLLAFFFLIIYFKLTNKKIEFSKDKMGISILAGIVFALEFLLLFLALDFTSVARNSILYYSMPIWVTVFGHFFLPNERLNFFKSVGLISAFAGVALAVSNNNETFSIYNWQLIGDFFAIMAAILWAMLIYLVKGTSFKEVPPEMQLVWMVMVSAPILLIASLFFGDLVREFQIIHLWGLLFQSIVVVAGGFLFWLWLAAIYPASGVASFSFLSPIFTILFGWVILNETVNYTFIAAAILVIVGLVFINKKV
ncbi:MAG: DMT family transporter [Planktomarina sp.]|nr:DMT family transporter [Planktomarina sp.]